MTADTMAATIGATRPGLFSTGLARSQAANGRGGPPSLSLSELMII
jgi:hypothetical protein